MSISEIALGVVCPMANEGSKAICFTAAVLEKCVGFNSVRFFAVLDKASQDDTLGLLRNYQSSEPRLSVVWAPENRCVVDAYVRGYREALAAGADWILEIDAGFSHQPADIPQFFVEMQKGYDCVFGSRFMKGGAMAARPWTRYLVSYGGTKLANLLLGTRLSDMTSGFELFSRQALEMVMRRGIQSQAHFFQTEIKTYCRKLRIKEAPIHYRSPSPRLGLAPIEDAFRQLFRLVRLRIAGQL